MSNARIRTALICHHDAPLHYDGVARWLATWSDLAGIIVIHEPRGLLWKRLKRENKRVGALRVLDVLAFRAYYKLRIAGRDQQWRNSRLARMIAAYPEAPQVPRLDVTSPNEARAQEFLRQCRPDIVLALCKNILAERIFSIAAVGTFVTHPGICPEYRNSHGCFWALANDDTERVGMTLLRIDRGVDTGPILGYFTYPYDEVRESHIVIQNRVLLDNLPALEETLKAVAAGDVAPVSVEGRASREWGQPWLTRYLRWKRRAAKRSDARSLA